MSVNCRGGYVYSINAYIDTSLNNSTGSDGVNNMRFRCNRKDRAGCEIIFELTKNIFLAHKLTSLFCQTFFSLSQIVHLSFMHAR